MTRSAPHAWHGTPPAGAPSVVVGVHPGQAPEVVLAAADLARRLGAVLVCVWADGARVAVGRDADGGLRTTPLDPDAVDDADDVPAELRLERDLDATLAGTGVAWLLRYTVGEAAHALRDAAHEHDALLLVVGPRRPGVGGWMDRVVGGTVAGRLVHTQHLPVVVVPVASRPAS